MKKIVLFLAILLAFSSAHAQASADYKLDANKALTKFSRGVTNVATSPGEFLTQMPAAMEQSPDYLTGTMMWIFRGIGYTIARAGTGLYDIATFPIPFPKKYKPVMKPETIFDQTLDTTISQTLPN